jgi:hypothetical protein
MGMVRRDRRDGTTARIAWAASFLLLVTMLLPAGAHAGPVRGSAAGAPARKAGPVLTPPGQANPIQLNPAAFDALYHAQLKTDLGWYTGRFHFVLDQVNTELSTMYTSLKAYQKHAEMCETRTYTKEDQQKAGCLGTDTLNQCSTKLFDHCFGAYKNDPFLKDRKKLLGSMDWLEKKLNAYRAQLKAIPKPK